MVVELMEIGFFASPERPEQVFIEQRLPLEYMCWSLLHLYHSSLLCEISLPCSPRLALYVNLPYTITGSSGLTKTLGKKETRRKNEWSL
jgi:hypothetical protein